MGQGTAERIAGRGGGDAAARTGSLRPPRAISGLPGREREPGAGRWWLVVPPQPPSPFGALVLEVVAARALAAHHMG